MKARLKSFLMLMFILCASLLIIACSNDTAAPGDDNGSSDSNDNEPDTEQKEPEASIDELNDGEPVTITIQVHWDEEMFNTRFKEPIEKAFPYITVEQVQSWRARQDLEEMFANGHNPDIFFEVSVDDMIYLDIDYDLDELIEKFGYDTSHINPVYLDSLRAKDPQGRLLGLPYEIINYVLIYNKDIFDLFGEEYPTPGMTWAEALEKGRRMTGERNGIYYRGIDLANPYVPLMQLAVNLTDPETGEVQFDQPEVAMYFDLLDEIINIQGTNDGDHFDGGRFVSQQTTAMTVEFVQALNWWQNEESLNEAVAPLPVWDDRPPVSHRPDGGIIHLSINPHSPHKEVAFRILTYFTEYEYQLFASRQGIGPSTVNEEVLSEFFQDYDFADETNVASMFEFPPANPPMPISPWDKYVDLNPGRYATSGMDRNEYLRVIAEETAAKIEEAKVTEAES